MDLKFSENFSEAEREARLESRRPDIPIQTRTILRAFLGLEYRRSLGKRRSLATSSSRESLVVSNPGI